MDSVGLCMKRLLTFQKKKIVSLMLIIIVLMCAQCGRLVYLMIFRSEYYEEKAQNLHERERSIKAARGRIVDRNGVVYHFCDSQPTDRSGVCH